MKKAIQITFLLTCMTALSACSATDHRNLFNGKLDLADVTYGGLFAYAALK
jgi:hypothetical protein